jgi:hypothetical protein
MLDVRFDERLDEETMIRLALVQDTPPTAACPSRINEDNSRVQGAIGSNRG